MSETYWQAVDASIPDFQKTTVPTGSGSSVSTPAQPFPPNFGRRRRLGQYFEDVHAVWLQVESKFQVLAENLVLRGPSGTFGEIDSLLTDTDGQVVHREVAVKYYLGVEDDPHHSNWIGPRTVDRLDLKLTKMRTHQICLARKAVQNGIWPQDHPLPDRREALVTGAFFRRIGHKVWPDNMGPRAERGFWLPVGAFEQYADGADGHDLNRDHPAKTWVNLQKPWWLSPEQRRFETACTTADICKRVRQTARPQLVSATKDSPWPHEARGFVVPDGWPASSAPRGDR